MTRRKTRGRGREIGKKRQGDDIESGPPAGLPIARIGAGSGDVDQAAEESYLRQRVGAGYMGSEVDIEEIEGDQDRSRQTGVEKLPDAITDREGKGVAGEATERVERKLEDVEQVGLNKVINDFWAKQSQIAEMRARKTSRFASLWKTLGIKTKNLEDDEEVRALEKESHSLYRDLMAKGISLYKGDKAQLENFLKQFDEFEIFRSSYNSEMKKRTELAGFPENILAGFYRIGKRWNELKKWQQIAIGAAGGLAVTGGALMLGAGAFGAVALSAGWRWGFRGFGAAAAGIGRFTFGEKKLKEELDKEAEARFINKMKILQEYEYNLEAGIAAIIDQRGVENAREKYEKARLENTKKAINLAAWSFAISSIVGESLRASGISFSSVLKRLGLEAGFGGGAVGQQPAETLYTRSPDGKIILTPEGIKSIGDTPTESVELSPEDREALERLGSRAGVQTPEVAEPKLEEIAVGKIGKGGSLWGSIEKNIRANPGAYGLDPNDPGFTRDVQSMTKQMLDEFASRKDLTYEELDRIARMKVRPEDTLKIIYNPGTEEFHLEYEGKAFGPDVAPEEIKAKVSRTEHPAQKPTFQADQPRSMAEIEADYQQDLAQRAHARAVRNQEYLTRLHERQTIHLENVGYEATLRQGMATRGLLKNIIHESGIGNNVSLWDEPATKWYDEFIKSEELIPQDVSQSDAINTINKNRKILRDIFSQLPKPRLGETTWQAFLRALSKDPNNLVKINRVLGIR